MRRIRPLGHTFVRVTFSGLDLDVFGTDGLDQRVKLVLPLPGNRFTDFGIDDEQAHVDGTWYVKWRSFADHDRNPIRTYTVRAVRPEEREVDVDFVCHGDTGPASAWVSRAKVGDPLVIIGPDSRSPLSPEGIVFDPGAARKLLFAGDETAVPAISAMLESLAPGVEAHAVLEVPHPDDILDLAVGANVSIDWLARGDADFGSLLIPAVRDWYIGHAETAARAAELDDIELDVDAAAVLWDTPTEAPVDELYAWIAGESDMIKTVRRYLVRDCGIDRRQVAFMGYWRRGKSEGS